MNYNNNSDDLAVIEACAIAEATDYSLFLGDCGKLPLETRRALVQLLTGPILDGHRQYKLWPILLRDADIIKHYLAELFLELVIDRDLQVGFVRQADTGELETPSLLRRTHLTFIDSILLLYLRQKLMQADTQGEREVTTTDEIIEHLRAYERSTNTDHAGFIKRVKASIEKFKKYNILQKMYASTDRFEISPTLKLLFSAEEILALTNLYQNLVQPSEAE